MTRLTTDPTDPRLGRGGDSEPVPQNEAYLVLSEEERAKGFVRPYRDSYRHVGLSPTYPLRDLTAEERGRYGDHFAKYEQSPRGRFWTQDELDKKGCGAVTTMGRALSETYAREPAFYGYTYCVHCSMHRPVEEFVWTLDGQVVGS